MLPCITAGIDMFLCVTAAHAVPRQPRDAHFSIFRVNGDANYMKDEFYDLCDEFGILIHFEFMLSDCDYSHVMKQENNDNSEEHFLGNVRAEVTHQVRRAPATTDLLSCRLPVSLLLSHGQLSSATCRAHSAPSVQADSSHLDLHR